MKKKALTRGIAAVLSTALLGSALITGCGKSDEKETKTSEGGKISALLIQSQNNDGLQRMFEKLEEEENIKVDAQVIPDDQYLNILQMKQASGELPDIIQYNIPHLYNYLDPETELYDFSDEAWVDELLQPEVSQVDGKQYGFPLKANSGYQCFLYNKDFFEENNLSIPETTEEFDALCQQIKEMGVSPILLASDAWVPQIWMTNGYARALGSDEAAVEMTEAVLNGEKKFSDYPEMAEVIDNLLDIKEKGYFNDDIATLSWDDAWVELSDQKGAMLMGEAFMIPSNQAMFPDTRFGVFNVPLPFDEKDQISISSYTSGFAAGKDSENIEMVKKMFAAFATPDYLNLYFEDAPGLPAFEGVEGGELPEDILELYQKHMDAGTYVTEMNLHWGSIEPVFSEKLWTYYLEALTKGNMDGKAVLDNFQADVEKYLNENAM